MQRLRLEQKFGKGQIEQCTHIGARPVVAEQVGMTR